MVIEMMNGFTLRLSSILHRNQPAYSIPDLNKLLFLNHLFTISYAANITQAFDGGLHTIFFTLLDLTCSYKTIQGLLTG